MLENCPFCGKMFSRTQNLIGCSACREQEEAIFERLRDYFWENRTASLPELCAGTGVPEKLIRAFIKGGRLQQNSTCR